MSFSFTVVKGPGNIDIAPMSESMLALIPDGEYRINGHKHVEGTASDYIAISCPCGSVNASSPSK